MRLAKIIVTSIIACGLSSTWAETGPDVVREFHVFLPDNVTWNTSTPMIYEDGKSQALTPDSEHCGWFTRRYVNEKIPNKVVLHTDDDEELRNSIGFYGEASDTPQAIPLGDLFELFASEATFTNAIYFVADRKQAKELPSTTQGWFTERPTITGSCKFILYATIYDTDASLHPSFTCHSADGQEGCQDLGETAVQGVEVAKAREAINACIGVTTGIVDSTLGENKKPKLSATGKKCFIDEIYFNQLFNYTNGINEKSCFDIPFTRADHGKWEFNSDLFISPGLKNPVIGGFYPVEATNDDLIKAHYPDQQPIAAARKKHDAQGPVFLGSALRAIDSSEQVPVFNTICKGPGWDKGNDCNGQFGDGDKATTFIQSINSTIDCVFGWSCSEQAPTNWPLFTEGTETAAATGSTRWTSNVEGNGNQGRNAHFCAEAHASFKYKKGLKFSISGSDDIWVFINNKLAVDIGGTHLTAPGYVDVDKFMTNAEIGKRYDLDIFYCNRRTTSGSLKISTNMLYVERQASSISIEDLTNIQEWLQSGINQLRVCHYESSASACTPPKAVCNTADIPPTTKISYLFTKDRTGKDPAATIISEAEFAASPVQLNGIFDISDPMAPKVHEEKLKKTLAPGNYYLIIKINSDQAVLAFVVENTTSIKESQIAANRTNTFNVKKSSALEITITTNTPNRAKRFAIMDVNGHIVSVGELNNIDTRVKVPTAGSYIVKVGKSYKRINVK